MTKYFFPNNDRSAFASAEIGSLLTVPLLDEAGKPVRLSFRVTRNALLGSWRWIYGQALGMPGGGYYQIEFRLNLKDPRKDSAEMFLQAPPLTF